jgi:hypothetical protein
VSSKNASEIKPNTKAFICGYATCGEVHDSRKKDFGSKFGGRGGYNCFYIPILNLHPISELMESYKRQKHN